MRKDPSVDLKLQYRNVLEGSAALALLSVILMLMIFKKFDSDISLRALDVPTIQVEDIPITRTIKKIEVPRKPTIPVEDPEVDEADDVDLPDFDFLDPDFAPPPPPPSMADEIVPFFKIEVPPKLIGGQQAIADYIRRKDLFPRVAREAGVSGQVMIGFIVSKEGVPTNVKVLQERPPGLGFGDAGVKVMKAMRFTPGMQRDKPAQVSMQQPIMFSFE